MTDADTILGSSDLDRLAAFLDSPELPPGVMSLPELDGFLTALIIGPEPVPSDEWLPVIWGDGPPPFVDDAEAAAVLAAIMALHDDIQAQVTDGTYSPLFDIGEDDTALPRGWAVGFMTAASLRMAAWATLFESEQDDTIAYPILALCEDEDGKPLLDLSKKDRAYLLAEAPELVGQAVIDIADYWQQKNKPPPDGAIPVRTTPKIGRNDPCPCGSGKKYKKCCGASA
jgi:uncharacterized protein